MKFHAALSATLAVCALETRFWERPFRAPPPEPEMTEDDFAAICAAEATRIRKGAKRARNAERARLGAAIAKHVSRRERFEMAEAERRARSAGGFAR